MKALGSVNIIPQDIGRVLLNLFTNAFYAVTEKKNKLLPAMSQLFRLAQKNLMAKLKSL
jgi:hypothetical protein